MAFEINRLGPAHADRKSVQRRTYAYTELVTVADLVANDVETDYAFLDILDLTEVEKGQWTLLIAPAGGQITYKLDAIYAVDATTREPDVALKLAKQTDTVITDGVVGSASAAEIIPYLRIGIKLADTDATTVQFILALVV